MMKTLLVAALAAGCTAAAPTADKPKHDYAGRVPTAALDSQPATLTAHIGGIEASNDICALLPADGSCDAICDAGVLASTVPTGQCYDAVCQLTDGSFYRYGGCN